MRPKRYEIRIIGELDAATEQALAGCDVTTDGTLIVVLATLDDAALHGLLERIRRLQLDLLDVRQVRQRR